MSDRIELLDELTWRGMLHQHTEGLPAALAKGPLSAYCGFDPTASSLHVGSLVPVMGLVHLQRAGHRPFAVVGGGTGLIGDPSGKMAERQLLDLDTIATNASGLRKQLEHFLDFSGSSAAQMRNNADWLVPLNAIELLRDVGKHFTLNYMLAKESVQMRIDTGISFSEFAYMLLQAYDYRELYIRDGVTLQIGGSDQWGNITAGMELIRRTEGGEVNALTFPLMTMASGAKFGKTEAGNVWLDPERTSQYQFYQFWVNTDDRDVGKYLRYFTLYSREEVGTLEGELESRPESRTAQQALAKEVTTRVHGPEAARAAAEVSGLLFGKGDPESLSEVALIALSREVPFKAVSEVATVIDALVDVGLVPSKGAARRLIEQGGASVNGRRIGSVTDGPGEPLPGGYYLIKKGARDFGLLRLRVS
jgi:tyrosyl-tRNA synthetase